MLIDLWPRATNYPIVATLESRIKCEIEIKLKLIADCSMECDWHLPCVA